MRVPQRVHQARGAAKPSTPTTPTKFIPQTGDPIESAPIVVSAVLGVAILAVALVVSKRDKRN